MPPNTIFSTRAFKFPAAWPYKPSDFKRIDESVDSRFYASPRLVNHIDDTAIASLKKYYAGVIKPHSRVLDIASSWVSHLPDDLDVEVTGIGMNVHELNANPRLKQRIVQDLNLNPKMPGEDGDYDTVICNVSIDYLTKPRELCLDAARLLKPGGTIHLSISNRCFPTKVVARWFQEHERMDLVAAYLHFAGSEDGSKQVYRDIHLVEVVQGRTSDPISVVTGTKV